MNKEQFNPTNHQFSIIKAKYKFAAVPIAIIIISFVLFHINPNPVYKYFSIAGLFFYLFIFYIYRIRKTIPDTSPEHLLAPINGKISKVVNENKIIVNKSFFNPVEVRTMTSQDFLTKKSYILIENEDLGTKAKIFSKKGKLLKYKSTDVQGQLIGFIPGNGFCEIETTSPWKLKVQEGDKIKAGETVLFNKDEK
mgnify:CR=1 FL=1